MQAIGWWLDTLASGLPAGLRRWLGIDRPVLLVDLEGDRAHLTRRTGGHDELLGTRIPGEGPPLLADDNRVVVRLPAEAGLRRTLDLPGAVEENLAGILDIVEFELERRTPFRAAQVFLDYRIAGRNAGTQTLMVDLLLAPREQVMQAYDAARDLGLAPHALTVGSGEETLGFNLLPPALRPAPPRRSGQAWAVAGGLAVLVLACLSPWLRAELAVLRSADRLAQAEAQARPALELRARLDRRQQSFDAIATTVTGRAPATVLLEELTRLLPDNVSLSQLSIGAESIELQGTAASAAAIVPRLEASAWFGQAAFSSPVARDPATGLERFQISLKLKAAAG